MMEKECEFCKGFKRVLCPECACDPDCKSCHGESFLICDWCEGKGFIAITEPTPEEKLIYQRYGIIKSNIKDWWL